MPPRTPILALAALLALTLLALAAAPAGAQGRAGGSDSDARVVLAFLPSGGDENPEPVLDRLDAREELAIGLMSATQGRYSAAQAALDMTAGTRTSAAAYDPESPPKLELIIGADGTGFVFGWSAAVRRAESAIAAIQPGLLASAIPGGVAYDGIESRENVEAAVAADRGGDIAAVSLGTAAGQASRVQELLGRHRLVVAGLATGSKGDATLDALIRERREGDLLLVVQTPPAVRALQLLPAGAAGLQGGARGLTSTTTRLEGIVASIDVTATVLRRLGIDEPGDVKGTRIRAAGPRDAAGLKDLEDRLKVVSGRRNPTLFALLFSWLTLVFVLGLAADRRGVRAGMRIGALGVLWVLPLLLLAGLLAVGRAGEIMLIVGGALALGALTDRFVRWPRAPVVPTTVSLVTYGIDLAFGSPLIVRSLLGVNPRSGSRFYGLGNELEAVLTALMVVGVAAALHGAGRSRRSAAVFAGVGLLLGVFTGYGRFGADVGGVITVGAAVATATLLMLPGAMTRTRIATAVAVPVLALAALAVLDLATAGNGHFTRTVLQAESGEALRDVVERRYTLAYNVLSGGAMPFLTVLALLGSAYAVRYRERIYAPVRGSVAWRAGLMGGLAGSIVGSLTNDSGPILLVFGVFVLASTTAYVRGDPALAVEDPSGGSKH